MTRTTKSTPLQKSTKVYKNNKTAKENRAKSQLIVKRISGLAYRSVQKKVDCGNYECYEEYRMETNCIIYLETNQTQCNIPCLMTGCKTEVHHFTMCPLWICNEKPTTSTTSTTTITAPMTTSKWIPPTPKNCEMSFWIYSSIVLNIFFFAIIGAVVVYKIKKFFYNQTTNRNLNSNRFFCVSGENDEEENAGLLSNEVQAPVPQEQQSNDQQEPNQIEIPQQQQQQEQPLASELQHGRLNQSTWDDIELAVPNEDSGAASLNSKENPDINHDKNVFLLMKALNNFKKK
jgi:hypothetical protein